MSLALVACDTMIMDRLVVSPPTRPKAAAQQVAPPEQEALEVVRATLKAAGLAFFDGPSSVADETWRWRDPAHPPGLAVAITQKGSDVHIRLSQDLYGPIGPTDKYKDVWRMLVASTTAHFGSKNVRVE